MGTLAFERGVATLGQQIGFQRELDALVGAGPAHRRGGDPLVRDRLARAWIGLEVLRAHALRTLAAGPRARTRPPGRASVIKLLWSHWHRDLGELAMDVLGARAMDGPAASRRPRRAGSGCSCSAGPTRSTAAPTRSSATSSPSARSACPGRPGHDRAAAARAAGQVPPPGCDLLDGKVVVVTAAAGTGIGLAAARALPRRGRAGRHQRHPRAAAGRDAGELAASRRPARRRDAAAT